MHRVFASILVLALFFVAPALHAAEAVVETPPAPEVLVSETDAVAVSVAAGASCGAESVAQVLPDDTLAQACDPNRECTTDAQCQPMGYCATWRLCICTG